VPPFSFWTQWGAFHRKSPVPPPRTPMGPQNAHGVKRAEEHPRICQTTSGSKLWTVSERHERLVIQQQGVMEPDGREVAPVRRHIHQSECCSTGKSKLAGHARRIANTPGLAPRLPVVTRAHLSAFQFSRGRKDRLIRRPCCTSRAGRCVRKPPFWRGETGAAWEFHGSDGSVGAPWLSIHLCRCGLAFTVVSGW
jgi:hypothetical protein